MRDWRSINHTHYKSWVNESGRMMYNKVIYLNGDAVTFRLNAKSFNASFNSSNIDEIIREPSDHPEKMCISFRVLMTPDKDKTDKFVNNGLYKFV